MIKLVKTLLAGWLVALAVVALPTENFDIIPSVLACDAADPACF